jgi:hypothetical protein
MVANAMIETGMGTAHCVTGARGVFHGPRARELNTLMLARGIGFWFSALGLVEQINHALTLETQWMSRLVGDQV